MTVNSYIMVMIRSVFRSGFLMRFVMSARLSCCAALIVGMLPGALFAQEMVNVRSADHPDFTRVVFDWRDRVEYRPTLNGDYLEISFDRTATPNWNTLENRALRFVGTPTSRVEEGRLIVRFKVTAPAQLSHFRDGTKVAFDVSRDQQNSSDPAVKTSPAGAVEQEALVPSAAPMAQGGTETQQAEQDQRPVNSGALKLGVNQFRGERIRLSYPWETDKLAAVFTRYNTLWVVFEDYRPVDQTRLDRFIGKRILSGRQIEHPSMTVLVYAITPGQNVKAQKIGTGWHIDLQDGRVVPSIPIPGSHKRIANTPGENFFFSVKNSGPIMVIEDPVIGDDLAIVPVAASSQGVIQAHKYTEFEALETAQGIAVQLIADNLSILKHRNGVSVSNQNGLAISQGDLSSKLGLDVASNGEPERLIDFPSWAKGPLADNDDYHANKHELLYQLANATNNDRNEKRWRLARFYLANGRVRSAYGILNVMKDDDAALQQNPSFRTVLGVANILMRRFDEGAKLLTHKSLIAEESTFLWRAVAHSGLGDHEQALKDFLKGADILSLQEPRDRIRFLFAAIQSAYAQADRDFVESALTVLRELPLNADEMTDVDYWQALLERDNGNPLGAEGALEGVVKAGARETAARAKLDLVNLDLEREKITNAEAIDQLEKLRFAWRGDDFELELLSRLGDLYVAQNDFYTGLKTLKLAVTFFKNQRRVAVLTRQMNRIYSDLFLSGKADSMEPVRAVALYSEFRELIPLGADGDQMARRLADRLVSIDLLEEAEELLEHQIEFRLKGGAQAAVASRLAMIYLLDSKPDKALGILRATRNSQIPRDIVDRRNMIEVRALIELERFEEAEVMVEPYRTAEAEELRSDIYWKDENWDKYIAHSNRLLGGRYQQDAVLTPEERLAVLRLSVAYAINNDKAGIKVLRDRYKSHMDDGLYGDTFEVITAEQQSTDTDVRRLTRSIASVAKLETFMESYRAEFTDAVEQN
ncbi:tetratricopeptide repeat protein [Paremcibacter congregatus]|uniref:tetratricopeptide repeat protein n=1 Tax=Paremcibacter congregatus TaxID=2043170 RepID=UPI003A8E742C